MTDLIICIIAETLAMSYIVYEYFKLKKENEINYSNYQNCLRALAEYDPRLKEKLKKEGKIGGKI